VLITIDSDFPTTRVSFFFLMKSSHFSSINPGIYQAKYTYIPPLCYWLLGPIISAAMEEKVQGST
jgi:hypothetical protein